jgi:predicted porin
MHHWKRIVLASMTSLALTAGAGAADLPTKKEQPPPEKPNCFSSFWTWLNSTAKDCPLSAYGITVYGTIDMGYGYNTFGAPWNRYGNFGNNFLISKAGMGGLYAIAPNALSQSNVGVKIKEDIGNGWSIVGLAETGFDPYSFQLANGPRALAENTTYKLPWQSSSGDSARAGQWDNSQGYVGVSNTTFGTLTYGRQNTLTLDGVNAYDPMGGSYAFSVIGFSGTTAGSGNTEETRSNTAFKYRVSVGPLRASTIVQTGGFAQGNGNDGLYEVGVGLDVWGFSFDVIGSYVQDSVKLSTNNSPWPTTGGFEADALKATLSNDTGIMALGKYKWNQLTIYGGYEWIQFANPTNNWANATTSPFITTLGGFQGVNQGDQFYTPETLQVFWAGARYSILPNLDVAVAYYHYDQGFYMKTASTTPCTAKKGSDSQASNCAGTLDAVSGLIDWHFFARMDAYAGVMWSQVSGGQANGYNNTPGPGETFASCSSSHPTCVMNRVNLDPTIGIRVQF